jgi:plasmid maintenance system killer protein
MKKNTINILLSVLVSGLLAVNPGYKTKADSMLDGVREKVEQALSARTFYSYNVAYAEIMNLPDSAEKNSLLASLGSISSDVWTPQVKKSNELLADVCTYRDGKTYAETEAYLRSLPENEMDIYTQGYFLGELTSWGKKFVYTEDYVNALNALMDFATNKTIDSANKAIVLVNDVKNRASQTYLLNELNNLKAARGIVPYMSDILKPYYNTGNYEINTKINMAKVPYDKGFRLDTNNFGDYVYSFNLDKKYSNIKGLIGLPDGFSYSTVTVSVYGDDILLKKYELKAGELPQNLSLDVNGVAKLTFEVSSNNKSNKVLLGNLTISDGKIIDSSKIAANLNYMSDTLKPYYNTGNYEINTKINMAKVPYDKGFRLDTNNFSDYVYSFNLDKKYSNIKGLIGLPDGFSYSTVTVSVYGDDILLKKYELKAGELPQNLSLDVNGVAKLTFKVSGNNKDNKVLLGDITISDRRGMDSPKTDTDSTYMSDILKPYYATGNYEVNTKVNMARVSYDKGFRLDTNNFGDYVYSFNLDKKYSNIKGLMGLADGFNYSNVTVSVYGDDILLRSYEIKTGDLPQDFTLDVSRVAKLTFKVSGNNKDNKVLLGNLTIK